MLYNPLKRKITRTIQLPLYYTGLTQTATLSRRVNKAGSAANGKHEAAFTFTLEPESYTWYLIQ